MSLWLKKRKERHLVAELSIRKWGISLPPNKRNQKCKERDILPKTTTKAHLGERSELLHFCWRQIVNLLKRKIGEKSIIEWEHHRQKRPPACDMTNLHPCGFKSECWTTHKEYNQGRNVRVVKLTHPCDLMVNMFTQKPVLQGSVGLTSSWIRFGVKPCTAIQSTYIQNSHWVQWNMLPGKGACDCRCSFPKQGTSYIYQIITDARNSCDSPHPCSWTRRTDENMRHTVPLHSVFFALHHSQNFFY